MSPTSGPIRLAVIGCGRMASELAHRSVNLGRAQITAIHDIKPEVLRTRCEEFGAEPVENIESLLGKADIDAFLIGSPGYYHHENVLAVAPEGKPIYSEKPLSTTVPLCNEMIDACAKSGAKLFVGQVLRLFPLFWKSREIIDSGVLGRPRMISITRASRGMHYSSGWRASRRESGGPILETNAHELDYLNSLLGIPQQVYARGMNLNGWGDYPDAIYLQIRYQDGGLGMLDCTNAAPIGEYRVHLQAENGSLLHGGFGGELRYRTFAMEDPTVVTMAELSQVLNPYDRELTSYFDWIEHDTQPLFTGETGRLCVSIADAVYRSLESGLPEAVQQFKSSGS